jgi:hypothetical protein
VHARRRHSATFTDAGRPMQELLDAIAGFVWGPFLLIPLLLLTACT